VDALEFRTGKRYRPAYPPEFRRQLVELVRSGRTPDELAREFEPTAQSISMKQAAGKRADGPTSAEREELGRPRRETPRLRPERDILAKPAWFARESKATPNGLPVHERAQSSVERRSAV
jgi:transposase